MNQQPFEKFAYDPRLPLSGVESAVGLEKLKYVADRGQAKALYDLWHSIHEPRVQAESNRRHQEQEHERRVEYATKAHAGKYGEDEQDLAIEVFGLSFPSVVPRELLQSFFRGVAALRHARANRVTGDE